MEAQVPTSSPEAQSSGEQLLSAWWNFGQVLKRHVAPMLEREHNVDFKDFVALSAIEAGANYPSLMCERMAMTPSGVSRILEDLTRRQLVVRTLDPHDSRRVRLQITPKGEDVLRAARSTMLGLLNEGLTQLPSTQVQLFVETITQLNDLMARATETPGNTAPKQEQ